MEVEPDSERDYVQANLVMPIRASEKAKYPRDWPAISKRIRERASQKCEWPDCGAPNRKFILRLRKDPEVWTMSFPIDPDDWYPVEVVLTVAHLDPAKGVEDCSDGNLKALCQLHHLRLDAKEHARHARETREAKSGQKRLFP